MDIFTDDIFTNIWITDTSKGVGVDIAGYLASEEGRKAFLAAGDLHDKSTEVKAATP